jgi:hypothetical protein
LYVGGMNAWIGSIQTLASRPSGNDTTCGDALLPHGFVEQVGEQRRTLVLFALMYAIARVTPASAAPSAPLATRSRPALPRLLTATDVTVRPSAVSTALTSSTVTIATPFSSRRKRAISEVRTFACLSTAGSAGRPASGTSARDCP